MDNKNLMDIMGIHIPDVWNMADGTVLKAFISAIVDEFIMTLDQIDHINGIIGIDGGTDDELDERWGALLNVKRRPGESDDRYRNRLKTSVIMLSGGTKSALKYATLVALDKDSYPYIDIMTDSVQILDSWDYDGPVEVDKGYGNIIVLIDVYISSGVIDSNTYNILVDTLNQVKSAGTNVSIIWYMIDGYDVGLNKCSYSELGIEREGIFDYNDGNLLIDIHDMNSEYTVFKTLEGQISADDEYDSIIVIDI